MRSEKTVSYTHLDVYKRQMMAFMPAGLVLYWVTNGGLGLLQQWWMTKRHGQPPAGKAVVATK